MASGRVACTVDPYEDTRSFGEVAARLSARGSAAIVVPLDLDLPARGRLHRAVRDHAVGVAGPLGTHPLVVEALAQRSVAAGARPQDMLVLAAAGEEHDLDRVAALLQARRGGVPVVPAFLDPSAHRGHGIAEVIATARRAHGRRIVVVPHRLAADRLAHRIRALAEVSGADAVAEVLGAHHLVVEMVARCHLALTPHLERTRARCGPGTMRADSAAA